jgi:hypothetical protein
MANKKISEFETASAVVDSVVPVSDAAGTVTNKVTLQSIAQLATAEDVGLGNVDNTSDLDKPISDAVQDALDDKAPSVHDHDDLYYTEAEIDNLLAEISSGDLTAPGSHEIYVDNGRTDTYVEDGSIYRPFKTMRAALGSVSSAANKTEYNDPTKRFYCFRISPGFYDEEAGGTLNIPFRPNVVFDLTGGVTLKGNYKFTDPGGLLVADNTGLGNGVFAMFGGHNRPAFNNGIHSYVGILGNLTVERIIGTSASFVQVHLVRCGVRGTIEKISAGPVTSTMQLFCWNNSSFDTAKALGTNNITFWGMDSVTSPSGNGFGNLIGRVGIQTLSNCWFNNRASIFTTGSVALLEDGKTLMPFYNEIKANSFTRTNNVATVTLASNHGQSISAIVDGYVPEQYVLISGVAEDTSFNTEDSGAKVVSYPAANQVSYENVGPDVSPAITAANALWIKGTFFGNASGFIQVGQFALATNEASIHTHPGWRTNTQPGAGSASILGRAAGVPFRYPATSWTANSLYVRNRLLTPGNGFQYRAVPTLGVGRSGTTEPTWPTTVGQTVIDGTVTWICEALGFVPSGVASVNVQQALEVLHDSKNIYHNQSDSGVVGATTVQAAINTLKTEVDGKPSLVAVPASATSAGTAGQIAYDDSYLYVCVATNTWLRTPIATW